MTSLWHQIKLTENIIAVNEMPKGTMLKYSMDREAGVLVMHGRIATPIPSNFGFIPQTMDDTNEPLGVFIYSNFSLEPLSVFRIDVERIVSYTTNDSPRINVIATLHGDGLDWIGAEKRQEATVDFLTRTVYGCKVLDVLDHSVAKTTISIAHGNYMAKIKEKLNGLDTKKKEL